MLVLCSNGLSSEQLLAAISNRLSDCSTAALVVTADNEYKEENYHVARCIEELESLNLSVDVVDLDKQSATVLQNYDVVEFIGGNPYYLLHVIRESNAIETLKSIADNRVLIGWSASSFVFSRTLELVNRYSPEMNFLNLTDLSGLALTHIEVLPHYSKFVERFDSFEETCCDYEKQQGVKVIRLNDGEGVIIDGGETYICKV